METILKFLQVPAEWTGVQWLVAVLFGFFMFAAFWMWKCEARYPVIFQPPTPAGGTPPAPEIRMKWSLFGLLGEMVAAGMFALAGFVFALALAPEDMRKSVHDFVRAKLPDVERPDKSAATFDPDTRKIALDPNALPAGHKWVARFTGQTQGELIDGDTIQVPPAIQSVDLWLLREVDKKQGPPIVVATPAKK